jgi:predicted alpha/beta hydrolase
MRLQPTAINQSIADRLAALETQKRKYESILRSLRAYQQMKPSSRQAQAIRDNENALDDIKAGIARLKRTA